MKFIPHEYQQYCIDKLMELPAVGLFLDMGLGPKEKQSQRLRQ